MSKTLRQAIVPLVLIIGVITVLGALQRQLIFFPSTAAEDELLREADWHDLAPWRDQDNTLIGWRTPGRQQAEARILVFHGNAGYALHRQYYAAGMQALGDRWEVVLFEYPGYGARAGTPSADVFRAAAVEALQLLLREDDRPLYVLGESLGSGVASYLAARFPDKVAGLLLVTPFTSLADVAAHHYPILPVRALLSENFDSSTALARYRGPVAFLVAGRDEVVTTELGQQVHDDYAGPKWLRIIAGAGHNTLPMATGESWWQEVSDFLRRD